MIDSILSGLGAPSAGAAGEQLSDEDSENDSESEDMDTGDAMPTWMPDIPTPAITSAYATGEDFGKPGGLSKLVRFSLQEPEN